MLEIDGSKSHGGGSIIRLASGFAVLTNTPVKITNIRAGRPKPGLQEQHLAGLRAIKNLCEGKMIGDELGSMEVEFYPKPVSKSVAEISIATAGSIGLVIQPILIASLSSPHPIRLSISGGGTFGKWAPPISFLENITFRHLEKMGFKIYMEIIRHGFYPKGGGKLNVEIIPPREISSLRLPEMGSVLSIGGISTDSTSLKEAKVAERQKYACYEILDNYFEGSSLLREISVEHVNTESPGSCLTCWIETEKTFLGADMLGEPGLRADILGRSVADEIIRLYESKSTLDELTADQILPFMLFAGNSIAKVPRLTEHIETSIWISEKFLGKKFEIVEEDGIIIKT